MFKKCVGALIAGLILLTLTPVLNAEEVSLHKARLVGAVHANAQVIGRPITLREMDLVTAGIETEAVSYLIREVRELRHPDTNRLLAYILDLTPRGFVVVSPNTNIRPVIAYSFKSNFDMTEHPQNTLLNMLRFDLRNRTERMEQIPEAIRTQNQRLWRQYVNQDGNLLSALSTATQWGPLLTTTWGLRGFYNDTVERRTGITDVPVGCVAVAMAHIIRFHEFPPSVNFDYNYLTRTEGIHLRGTINITFDYAQMPDKLTSSNQQVADLMYACGVSLRMNYTSRGSGASTLVRRDGQYVVNVLTVLHYYFGYPRPNAASPHKGCPARPRLQWPHLFDSDFYTRVTNNIKDSLPVYLEVWVEHDGRPVGHAVVADGYNEVTGKHHLNLGWGGRGGSPNTKFWYSLPDIDTPYVDYNIVSLAVLDITPPSTVPAPTPQLHVYPATMSPSLQRGTGWTNIGTISVTNPGGGTLIWSETDNRDWISASPNSGITTTGTDRVTVEVTTADLAVGSHTGTITFIGDSPATGSPDQVTVTLTVTASVPVPPPPPPSPPGGDGGGCFIATAAYGTPLAEEIEVLRRLRDEHLLTNPLGRTIVSAYEKISPPLAELIREEPILKSGVRIILRPLIWMSRKITE